MSQDNKDIAWLLEEKYNGEKTESFFTDCRRLALGEPLGYLIGHVPFLGTTIHLDSRPLIPRPETEFWADQAIEEIKNYDQSRSTLGLEKSEPLRIMDMCAGSGCVGVAVKKALPEAHVDFAELEKKHLSTIAFNLEDNGLSTELTEIKQSNLFSAYPEATYNFILANPPYIDSNLHRVDQNVVDFEPHTALFGGHGGLEVIIQLITEAKYHLEPDGQLWMEHEPEQSSSIAAVADTHGYRTTTHKDQYDVDRFSILVLQ